MIKGAIEQASPQLVSGWIYSPLQPLKGELLLAFLGKECVGAGRAEFFRKDLADAGLDDGYLGFHFPIALPPGGDPGGVVVRLDGCEAVLVQPASRIASAGAAAAAVPGASPAAAPADPDETARRMRWLRRRNALSAAEADILGGLLRFGVYEVALDSDATEPEALEAEALALATRLLELTRLTEVTVKVDPAGDAKALQEAIRASGTVEGDVGYVVLRSPVATRIGVLEGSHQPGPAMDPAGAVDYHLESGNVLVVHGGCTLVPRRKANYGAMLVVSGRLAAAPA